MALALNTSHPLYSSLKLLVGVDDDNEIKDFVTPSRTMTVNAAVTLGTGTYGRHFTTTGSDNYTPQRVTWSALDVARTGTVLVVVNNINAVTGTVAGKVLVTASSSTGFVLTVPAVNDSNLLLGRVFTTSGTTVATDTVAGTTLNQGALMLATGYDSEVGIKVWKNGTLGVTDTTITPETGTGDIVGVGGRGGNGTVRANFVWVAVFDRILTDTEIADLYASLGADNAFALVSSGSAPDPEPPSGTVTIGTITPSSTSASVAYSYSAADQTGFEYRLNGGAAASIGASPATITGLTASTPYSLEVRAINAAGAGSWSAAYNFNTAAAGDTTTPTLTGVVSFSDVTQTSYTASWPAGSDNVAVTGYEYQIGGTAGAWTDAGNNLSAAITGRTAGATETVYVRAYDAAGNHSTPPIAGTVTLLSASTDGTITVTEPLKNNTGTLLANLSGVRVAVLEAATLAGVYETSGLTTNASGLLAAITDAAITTGQQYHVVIKLADGSVGITGPITAS